MGPRGPTEQEELGEERSEEGDSGMRRVGMRGRRAGQSQTPSGGGAVRGCQGSPCNAPRRVCQQQPGCGGGGLFPKPADPGGAHALSPLLQGTPSSERETPYARAPDSEMAELTFVAKARHCHASSQPREMIPDPCFTCGEALGPREGK